MNELDADVAVCRRVQAGMEPDDEGSWLSPGHRRLIICSGQTISAPVGRPFTRHEPDPVALVTHGGVTIDLLRNVFGDDAVAQRSPSLMDERVPSCAVTTLIGQHNAYVVAELASVAHLGHNRGR